MPEPRDPGLIQIVGGLQRDLPELQRQVDGRWGRVPHVAADPASPPDGGLWIRSDDRSLRYRANGASVGLPLGFVAQAWVTADQLAIGAGPSNMSNFDLVFTAMAGRRYKFTTSVMLFSSAASIWGVDLLDGATNLGRIVQHDTLGSVYRRHVGVVLTNAALSAGSHTLHMSIGRFTGTGTCDSYAASSTGAFLLVEDIGAF